MSPRIADYLSDRVDRQLKATSAIAVALTCAATPQVAQADLMHTSASASAYAGSVGGYYYFVVINFKTGLAPYIYEFKNATYDATHGADDDFWAWKAYPTADVVFRWLTSSYTLLIDGTNDIYTTGFAAYATLTYAGGKYAAEHAKGYTLDGTVPSGYPGTSLIGIYSDIFAGAVWSKGSSSYLGLELLTPSTSYHYAWVGIDISSTSPLKMTVTGVAWDTTAGTPVVTGTVPEPSSAGLLLLAAGAAGVARWRRRRDPELVEDAA